MAATVSEYVHLNPVRVKRFDLTKAQQARGPGWGSGLKADGDGADWGVARHWSVHTADTWDLRIVPDGSTRIKILQSYGGGRIPQQQQMGKYRLQVEQTLREGRAESPWQRLEAGLVLGGQDFVRTVRKKLVGDLREQPSLRQLQEQGDIR